VPVILDTPGMDSLVSVNESGVFLTALHEKKTRSSDEKAVRLSVCLSVRLSVRQTGRL